MSDRIERYGSWMGNIAENCNYGDFEDGAIWAVLDLVVDDGVQSRGHRNNIFTSALKYMGAGISPHSGYGKTLVCDYAGSITSNSNGEDIMERAGTANSKASAKSRPQSKPQPKPESKPIKKVSASGLKDYPTIKDMKTGGGNKHTYNEESKVTKTTTTTKNGKTTTTTKTEIMRSGNNQQNQKKIEVNTKKPKKTNQQPFQNDANDEPVGYVNKNTKTKSGCCGFGKKSIVTTYTFADGSTHVKTMTHKS